MNEQRAMAILATAADAEPRAWIQLYDGHPLDILAPHGQIRLAELLWVLPRLPRFTGHSDVIWSVGEHSLLVHDLAQRHPLAGNPVFELAAFLHDLHESVSNDPSSPWKLAVRAVLRAVGCDIDPISLIQDGIQKEIHSVAGLPWPLPAEIAKAVKVLDLQALALERMHFMSHSRRAWQPFEDGLHTPYDVMPIRRPDHGECFQELMLRMSRLVQAVKDSHTAPMPSAVNQACGQDVVAGSAVARVQWVSIVGESEARALYVKGLRVGQMQELPPPSSGFVLAAETDSGLCILLVEGRRVITNRERAENALLRFAGAVPGRTDDAPLSIGGIIDPVPLGSSRRAVKSEHLHFMASA